MKTDSHIQILLAGAEQDAELISKWGGATYDHFSHLHASQEALAAGCIATTGYALWTGGDNETPVPCTCIVLIVFVKNDFGNETKSWLYS